MKAENLLVSGEQKRLFVNTGIGCEGGCKYCYLPHIGISDIDRDIDKMDIIKEVRGQLYLLDVLQNVGMKM